jgi:glycerol-3-phosphate dehydrogenase (NAD(P)+)
MKITVLGAGSWGSTLATLLFENEHDVSLWEFDIERAKYLKDRKIKPFKSGPNLPGDIIVTNDLDTLKDSNVVLFAVPSQYMRTTCVLLKNNGISLEKKLIISATKGIENGTLLRMSEVIEDVFRDIYNNIAVLSGPSHAEEVCRKIPTMVTSAAINIDVAEKCKVLFMNNFFKIYSQTDIIGVELGAALKNVFAVASGIVDGLRYGDNTKAVIISMSLKELVKIGVTLGGKEQTFFGLSGMGDLMATCFSKYSRNRAVGQSIGEGKSLSVVEKSLGMVAEGVKNSISAYEIGKKFNLDLPIVNELYEILFKNKSPIEAVNNLMIRVSGHE